MKCSASKGTVSGHTFQIPWEDVGATLGIACEPALDYTDNTINWRGISDL